MAAQSIKVYAMGLWAAQKAVAAKLGNTDLRLLPIELRVTLIVVDLSLALVVQALVNAGIVTDAQVQAKIAEISGSTYNRLPDVVLPPDPDQGYTPPDPNLGA